MHVYLIFTHKVVTADADKEYDFEKHDPNVVMEATVKEYVNSRIGLLEVSKIGNKILPEPGIL